MDSSPKHFLNRGQGSGISPVNLFTAEDYAEVARFFASVHGYSPTPLRSLPCLAKQFGLGEVLVKDESYRLGLPSFKILGVLYAIYRLFRSGSIEKGSVLVCATDGNHGRALAHSARYYGLRTTVYMHKHATAARIKAIAAEGADITIVDGNYDDAVIRAAQAAEAHGWTLISDTAHSDYTVVPGLIMAGYTMLMAEAAEQWKGVPDIVFVQAGVGGLACAVVSWLSHKYGSDRPITISCEPENAACVLETIRAGQPTNISGTLETVMAGLSCGTISLLAWPTLQAGLDACMALGDDACRAAVRTLAHPFGQDPQIIAGESGACGLAALLLTLSHPDLETLRSSLQFGRESRIFLINTEGATDPDSYYSATGILVE